MRRQGLFPRHAEFTGIKYGVPAIPGIHWKPIRDAGYRPPAPEAFFKTFIVRNMLEMILCSREVRTQKTLT